MKPYVFPGVIRQDILDIGCHQIPYMRTALFSDIVNDCQAQLTDLMKCKAGRVIFVTGSGTASMDAVVSNYVKTKKRPIIIAGGGFGYRWSEICKYYGIDHVLHEVPFAKDIDFSSLESQIINTKPDVLLCQQHETSSGQLHNLEMIGALCKKYNIKLVVDVISSFLCDDLEFDKWGVSIAITSSQKGLNIPPGLSFIVISNELSGETFGRNNFYLDFYENLKNLERGQTPYSPATILFLQLQRRLHLIKEQGLENYKEQVKLRATAFRTVCQELGWTMSAQTPSNCVTGFYIGAPIAPIVEELLRQNIFIMPGGKPGLLRVSHTGDNVAQDYTDLAYTINLIKTHNEKL
ncbi:MAG: aminotransferase class V-fold PLP-dependent enzyme [Mucinivorans sp.]